MGNKKQMADYVTVGEMEQIWWLVPCQVLAPDFWEEQLLYALFVLGFSVP